MKTQDVLKTGIDRNFLRKCEDEKLICPKRNDSDWIIDKNYIPREYSQEEVEIVWNAYLCRKMGLSYSQIKDLTKGEEISVRDSLSNLIQKYENQIAELQALIEFMKYVKGVGFVPSPPAQLMGSIDFKNYLSDFIEYIDKDRKIKKILNMAEYMSEIDDIETVDTKDINHMELLYNELQIDKDIGDAYSSAFLNLKDKMHLNPSCDEVQSIIAEIFHYQKILNNNDMLSAWEFAAGFICMLSYDSDISVMYKNLLGEKAIDFLADAMREFLMIQEPDKMMQIKEACENTNKEKRSLK